MGALRDATSEVDVVVIGSGIGGLCAGDDGARVVLGPRWVMASNGKYLLGEHWVCIVLYIRIFFFLIVIIIIVFIIHIVVY